MATQTALIVQTIGGRVIEERSWPISQPGPRQVQIRVTVGALNPHDQKGRDIGLFVKDSLPAILGSDVVGVVSALGDSVSRFKIGDRIFGQASTEGSTQKALQQYAILDELFAAKVPEGISEDETATIPTNLMAGVVALFDESGLGLPSPWSNDKANTLSESKILIIGGGSNCGRFGTQLAKLAGFETVVVVGGDEEELKNFGATHVVDRHGDQEVVLQNIRNIVGDDLIYAFDAYNGPSGQHLAINALSNSRRGALARLVFSRGALDESKIHIKNAGYELKNVLGLSHMKPQVATSFWEHITEYMTQAKIKPLKYTVEWGLDAEKVNEVLDRYREGKAVNQVHFHLNE